MANASKNKGKSWERDVAKHLSAIYNINFQRVPNSGSFVGGFNAHRTSVMTPEQLLLASGDIILPAFLSHISLECKFYKDFSFESLLTGSLQLNKWLEQASVGKKIPFVIFKINRKGGFVVFPAQYHNKLTGIRNYIMYLNQPPLGNYIIVKMDGFFEVNKDALVALDEKNYTIYKNEIVKTSERTLSN